MCVSANPPNHYSTHGFHDHSGSIYSCVDGHGCSSKNAGVFRFQSLFSTFSHRRALKSNKNWWHSDISLETISLSPSFRWCSHWSSFRLSLCTTSLLSVLSKNIFVLDCEEHSLLQHFFLLLTIHFCYHTWGHVMCVRKTRRLSRSHRLATEW